MTTTYRLILCAAVAAAGGVRALAADPTAVPTTGHVLVLTNERTVEGDVERVGDQYRVRRAGGETWVPGDKVLRLCPDMDGAYRALRARANLSDPAECLRLARWCYGHGLAAAALENAAAAAKLDPDSMEAQRLVARLRRAATTPPAPPGPPRQAAEAPEVPELNTESSALFATKVEPILLNACANCHAANRGGSFKLTRAYDTTSANRLSVQQNLAAVLAQVNLQQPQESKLLVKAITAHDPQMRLAPLSSRQMAAYHTLEDWVQTTLASNPHLRASAAPTTGAPPEPKAAPVPAPAVSATPAPTGPAKPSLGSFAAGRVAPTKATAVDEFDPLPFNRQGKADDSKDDDDKP
jgi:hypothetical protein